MRSPTILKPLTGYFHEPQTSKADFTEGSIRCCGDCTKGSGPVYTYDHVPGRHVDFRCTRSCSCGYWPYADTKRALITENHGVQKSLIVLCPIHTVISRNHCTCNPVIVMHYLVEWQLLEVKLPSRFPRELLALSANLYPQTGDTTDFCLAFTFLFI
jgi:hypothetical protein